MGTCLCSWPRPADIVSHAKLTAGAFLFHAHLSSAPATGSLALASGWAVLEVLMLLDLGSQASREGGADDGFSVIPHLQ